MGGTTGAAALVRAATEQGVTTCFANPGTTELPLVAAMAAVPEMRCVLGLFEGVVAGAADGFGRISGTPALTLTHLGPGFGNAIANLHNARRAGTPVVNLVGDHYSWHRAVDSPLTSDIEALAGDVSVWTRTSRPGSLRADFLEGLAAAVGTPGIATLIAPLDAQWDDDEPRPASSPTFPGRAGVPASRVAEARARLQEARQATVYLGGSALSADALALAGRVEAAYGCRVFLETFPAKAARGRSVPRFRTMPYFPERAAQALGDADLFVSVGVPVPPAMFGTPEPRSSLLVPDATPTLVLADRGEDALAALAALCEDAGPGPDGPPAPDQLEPGAGELTAESAGREVCRLLPDGAIVTDESGTSGFGYTKHAFAAAPHTALGLTGGAIGMGLPVAVGAAVAAPDRKVVALQADGSALYTVQALWTMAREGLDVTVVLFSNRRYAILQEEMRRANLPATGSREAQLFTLDQPSIEWERLAGAFGVETHAPSTVEEFAKCFGAAVGGSGPTLIAVEL